MRRRGDDGTQNHDHEISDDVSGDDKKLFDEKERFYQIAVISIRLDELQTKGAVLQKMGKPTKSGTRMTFAPVQSAGEYEAEMQQILEDGKKLGLKFEKKKEEK